MFIKFKFLKIRVLHTRPVSVSVDDQLNGQRPVEDQAEVNSVVDIAKKALKHSKV
jgi:hypothetical protein